MAVVGLILGILSIIGVAIPGIPLWLLGVVGIILSAVARKKEKSGLATAGLVLSIIGTIIAFIPWIACTICAGAVAGSGLLDGLF